MACACQEEWWQKEFGSKQPKCLACLQTDAILALDPEKLRDKVYSMVAASMTVSSWLAVARTDSETVSMPREVAVEAAGWRR